MKSMDFTVEICNKSVDLTADLKDLPDLMKYEGFMDKSEDLSEITIERFMK